jgi:drug/metabolite transporter (DMT)-like permease
MILPRHFFDQAAIALSAVCIVHCLAVPVLIAVLPIAALSFGDATHFHALMLWLVVPTSVAGFGLGFRVHRRLGLVLLGAAGVAVLVAAALWGHSVWRESFEIGVSVVGGLILAAAHWLNFREVRRVHHHG